MVPAEIDWVLDSPAAISVCATEGTNIALGRQSTGNFRDNGGKQLIGTSLFAYHPERANAIIRRLQRGHTANTSVVKRKEKHQLVDLGPRYCDGIFAGLTETIIELPTDMPINFRD